MLVLYPTKVTLDNLYRLFVNIKLMVKIITIIIIVKFIMGNNITYMYHNYNHRITETLYALETWFVSGI
jgi:hypothetical protein